MNRYVLLFLTLSLVLIYPLVHEKLWEVRGQVRRTAEPGYLLPSPFSRILSLGHQGLVSDYLFLKTLTFVGQRMQEGEPFTEENWQHLIRSLDIITDLDPYFFDPYVFAEGMLTWEVSKYEEANRLLRKGLPYLENNWRLPFYIGFNHFYFLRDYEKGAEYIMQAARIEGSPAFLKTLAARLNYYGGRTRTGILFLRQMLTESSDPRLQRMLKKRLEAMEIAAEIEEKVDAFMQDMRRRPEEIAELVEKGYLDKIPKDPYGGDWILSRSGRIFSTSKFVDIPERKSQ